MSRAKLDRTLAALAVPCRRQIADLLRERPLPGTRAEGQTVASKVYLAIRVPTDPAQASEVLSPRSL